jgi:transmembrane sensor
VKVRYRPDEREFELLAGRAKFDVARDLHRPFAVHAGDRTVIATGTAFSVELLRGQVHVIVYEGHVAVVKGEVPARDLLRIKQHPGKAAIALDPGNELVAGADAKAPPRLSSADVSRSLSWEGGQLNFVDEPLASAVERLNRYSADKMVVADDRTAAIQVNGVFNAGDTDAFVEAVSGVYPVQARREGDEIVLSSRAN